MIAQLFKQLFGTFYLGLLSRGGGDKGAQTPQKQGAGASTAGMTSAAQPQSAGTEAGQDPGHLVDVGVEDVISLVLGSLTSGVSSALGSAVGTAAETASTLGGAATGLATSGVTEATGLLSGAGTAAAEWAKGAVDTSIGLIGLDETLSQIGGAKQAIASGMNIFEGKGVAEESKEFGLAIDALSDLKSMSKSKEGGESEEAPPPIFTPMGTGSALAQNVNSIKDASGDMQRGTQGFMSMGGSGQGVSSISLDSGNILDKNYMNG